MKQSLLAFLALALLACVVTRAADTNILTEATKQPAKPYLLKYCVVSGDKFDGDMGKPVTNYYKGQQIIFCCKDCIKDFTKDPDKYMKKLAEAQKKADQPGK